MKLGDCKTARDVQMALYWKNLGRRDAYISAARFSSVCNNSQAASAFANLARRVNHELLYYKQLMRKAFGGEAS